MVDCQGDSENCRSQFAVNRSYDRASVPLTRTGDIDISKYLNSSTFTVQAGERFCLSGLNQMIELAGESGVPILSKIRFWFLFKNYTDDNRQSKAYLIVKVDWKKVIRAPSEAGRQGKV